MPELIAWAIILFCVGNVSNYGRIDGLGLLLVFLGRDRRDFYVGTWRHGISVTFSVLSLSRILCLLEGRLIVCTRKIPQIMTTV